MDFLGKKEVDDTQLYQPEWEDNPQFSDWLAPVDNKPHRASCKVCCKEFAARKPTLVIHSNSKKHLEKLRNLSKQIDILEASLKDVGDKIVVEDMEPKLAKWSKYKKRYNMNWHKDPAIAAWIKPDPQNDARVICSYCDVSLRAHKGDLHKHLLSRKHKHHALVEGDSTTNEMIAMSYSCNSPQNTSKDTKFVSPEDSLEHHFVESLEEEGLFKTHITVQDDDVPIRKFSSSHKDRKRYSRQVTDITQRVGQVIINDLWKILHKQRDIMKAINHEDFSEGEEGLRRVAQILIGHLSQHYLVESALESYQIVKKRRLDSENHDNHDNHPDVIASKLELLESKMEKSVAAIRNLKMQVREQTTQPSALGITLDEADLPEIRDEATTQSISIQI